MKKEGLFLDSVENAYHEPFTLQALFRACSNRSQDLLAVVFEEVLCAPAEGLAHGSWIRRPVFTSLGCGTPS
jgi:hypothetical protein